MRLGKPGLYQSYALEKLGHTLSHLTHNLTIIGWRTLD